MTARQPRLAPGVCAKLYRRISLKAWACGPCTRCGREWVSTADAVPAACAGCKSPLWATPRVYGTGAKRATREGR